MSVANLNLKVKFFLLLNSTTSQKLSSKIFKKEMNWFLIGKMLCILHQFCVSLKNLATTKIIFYFFQIFDVFLNILQNKNNILQFFLYLSTIL